METECQDASSKRVARPEGLLRLRDVAARLDLSLSSVRRLIRNRKLPVVKLNTAVRVRGLLLPSAPKCNAEANSSIWGASSSDQEPSANAHNSAMQHRISVTRKQTLWERPKGWR
jgi:hypothetical protein